MTHRIAALLAAALASLAFAGVVLAHAELESSDPADGATIETPYTLTATFSDEIDVERSTLIVESSAGEQVAAGMVNADDHTMMTAELPALPDGVYTVRWTSVTPDDNGIERGTFTFNSASVRPPIFTPAPTPAPVEPAGSSNDALIAVGLAAVVILGVVAFIFLRRQS
jgi:methionine-rich copper-binding protein CopC